MNPSQNPSRREILTRLTVCGACAAVGLCSTDLFADGPAKGQIIDLAPLSEFPSDGVYDKYAKTKKLFILRKENKLYAASALCTHKGALLNKADTGMSCPKHKTIYDADGIPMKGPGKTSLPRYAIKIENARVIVDTNQVFEERQWEDPAASAAIEQPK